MANTLDLTTPKVVTITNNAKTVAADDAGALQRSKLYQLADGTIKARADMTDAEYETAKKIAYRNTDRQIQMYKTNTWVTVHQGDSVQITVQYPEELAYFLSLATDELSVVAADATTEDTTPETDPENP